MKAANFSARSVSVSVVSLDWLSTSISLLLLLAWRDVLLCLLRNLD